LHKCIINVTDYGSPNYFKVVHLFWWWLDG